MNRLLILFFTILRTFGYSQTTRVFGQVLDEFGSPIPGAEIRFQDTKIGTLTDSLGFYVLESYYATDTIIVFYPSFNTFKQLVRLDLSQTINVILTDKISGLEEIIVRQPDESPAVVLHKKVIRNKPINNKEKLTSYDYDVYNKIQLDLNNIGENFEQRKVLQKLEVIMNYLDSTDDGKTYLPLILSENISRFSFQNNPKRKKEIVQATRISGVENVQLNQFLGEMYLDFNVYDNYIVLFQKGFVSPVSNFARSFYKFSLRDSAFIDNQWCYKLNFSPKRTGDMTFEGEMWIHDTTYAVKEIKMNISPWANINYVQDLYFEHHFDQVEKEVWMLTKERMIMDLKLTKGTNLYGVYGRKYAERKNFEINHPKPDDFYKTDDNVEFAENAKNRDTAYWNSNRYTSLSKQEQGIDQMVDSLNKTPFFKTTKNLLYMAATGYYPLGKVELGNAFNLFTNNPVESYRFGLALRTSNLFSTKIELGGSLYYGTGDQVFKYSGLIRLNLSERKRTLLSLYGKRDIEQLGISPTATSVNSTFGNLLRTGPLNKLTMTSKLGFSLERDFGKDFVFFSSFSMKDYSPLGTANFQRINTSNTIDKLEHIQSAEIIFRLRYSKNDAYISGAFDRSVIPSIKPIFSFQTIMGVKGILGSDYNYQRFEFDYEQTRHLGIFGFIRYGGQLGFVNGTVAYPFLKIHEGSLSYWLYVNSFNRMDLFEFISDKYVSAFVNQHWEGLFFNRIPLLKKLQWRLVTTARIAYGLRSTKHDNAMLIPSFTKDFGKIPYIETSIGIENIFKVGRVDAVWRLTHLSPGIAPVSLRVRLSLNF